MGRGRGRTRCALWGGISLGVGTLAYALFSPSSAGCSTNLVVLTHGELTERGCAAYSVLSHVGVGLMVLGAVLLLGSFALALRWRRQVTPAPAAAEVPVSTAGRGTQPATGQPAFVGTGQIVSAGLHAAADPVVVSETQPVSRRPSPVNPEPEPVVVRGPIAPGEDVPEASDGGMPGLVVQLPPGWYGNPDVPGKPVQWWDGTKLTDGPR